MGDKFAVTAAYLSTPHSVKFAFLEYEVFYLAIQNFTFYELVISNQVCRSVLAFAHGFVRKGQFYGEDTSLGFVIVYSDVSAMISNNGGDNGQT